MTTSLHGRCACGDVEFALHPPFRPVFNCHCHRCRRISGHHMAMTAVAIGDLELVSAETVTWYEPAAGVFYGFCGRCGSSLFFRTDASPDQISVAAGSLEPPTGLETTEAWWVSEASDYHRLPDGLVDHELDG